MSSGSSDKTTVPILEQYELLWESDAHAPSGPDVFEFLRSHTNAPAATLLNVVLADQYRRWHLGAEIPAERYFEACEFLTDDMRFELVAEELGYQEERSGFDPVAFLKRFESILSQDQLDELRRELSVERTESSLPPAPKANQSAPKLKPGDSLGRYTLKRVLGSGSFGVVYLAQDTELLRDVAIKVPNAERISLSGGIEAFLNEARVVAALDHPAIVPIYDVAKTDDGGCYLVSKFIDGGDLRTAIERRLSPVAAASLIATIARAAHHAHRCQVIHRDIKPANVLLDESGNPYLVDFGLAMRDAEFGTGSEFVGTPAWMSPEQANGEGHRVDARSDVYSLGVVLFELLTGKRPYRSGSTDELLEQIRSGDVRPPRQFDDTIPRALDSICMKALARRASERYSTALDFAEELEAFVAENSSQKSSVSSIGDRDSQRAEQSRAARRVPPVPASRIHGATPMAQRWCLAGCDHSDSGDADFFLQLLPGPRDRFGVPDSLRFWASRVRQSDQTFPVGLLYGPSGCGKSSFMKAGLIPQLKEDVDCVYIEATQAETETRLLRALQTQRPELNGLGLPDALTDLRRGRTRKTLIVIDQFEQWLHTWDEDGPAN